MKKTYQLALHIFRRDLRLEDNTALMEALNHAEQVIPCFIFDDRQIDTNKYKSNNAIQFMIHSLQELDNQLNKKNSHLYYFSGTAEEVIEKLIVQNHIQAVFINRDYTPFSRKRDQAIETICAKHDVAFHYFADALLHEPEQVLKPDQKPYTVFTHAFQRAKLLPVREPQKNSKNNYYSGIIALEDKSTLTQLSQYKNTNLLVTGGRTEALALANQIKKLALYKEIRDIPSKAGTTHLSAHNKFGTLSIRELYKTIVDTFGPLHTLINELYWRDFFTHITFHFPHVMGKAFQPKYQHIRWENNERLFRAWCEGRTGFPIVDAGMRELNTTGYMHNRVRMITASFLCKDLHIDWRWGERYFAQQLVDYDPAVNNGNWQWAASTGCDAQPYFRIFNPTLQQERFDPEGIYIKHWIPELASDAYPTPIVDHKIASEKAKQMFRLASA